MPSEWLGVHGGRSYGPSPRGKSLPGPAVTLALYVLLYSVYSVQYFYIFYYVPGNLLLYST